MLTNTSCIMWSWAYKQDYCIFRHLKHFGYIRCNIPLSFLIDSAGCYLFPELCLPWLLCIIRCHLSKSAILYETHMNFWPYEFLASIQPRPKYISFHYNIWGMSLPEKVQDVHDLRWYPIHVRVGVEQRVLTMIMISGIDVSMPAFEPWGHFEYSPWHKLAKTL